MRELAPEALLGIQPFFLALGLRRPHLPFCFPEEFLDLYPETVEDDPRNPYVGDIPDIAWSDWGEMRAYEDCTADSLGDPDLGMVNVTIPLDKARELRRAYYAAVSYADSELGRVLAEVAELGLEDSTLVVFLGDHGWQLGEHAEWCKHTNFEVRGDWLGGGCLLPRAGGGARAPHHQSARPHRLRDEEQPPGRVCGHLPDAGRGRGLPGPGDLPEGLAGGRWQRQQDL